jgi:4-amino-4-deoxy-L-arabinose transferase-like glycosyltransferase
LVVITFAAQKYDRYALPLLPFLALLIGVGLSVTLQRLPERARAARWLVPAGLLVTALLAITTLAQAPYAISYADPLVGGQVGAKQNILLGWGEGMEALGAEIRHLEGHRCHNARTLGAPFYVVAFPCARLVTRAVVDGKNNVDYYVRYVSQEQRASAASSAFDAAMRRVGRRVKVVSIGGVHYAELWKIRPHAP